MVTHEYLARLIEAIDIAVYSYIKPAAPHRFSARFKDLSSMIFTVTSSLDVYAQAYEAGLGLSGGKETLLTIGVGRLVHASLARAYRRLGVRAYQALNVILIPSTIAVAYASRTQPFASSFRRVLSAILSIDNPKDVSALIEGLRQFYGQASLVLSEHGITPAKAVAERITVGEVISTLGARIRELEYFSRRMEHIMEAGAEFGRMVSAGVDLNEAAVRAFLRLASLEYGRLGSAIGADQRTLYELDRELTSGGLDLSHVVAPLALAIVLSNYY